MTNYRMSTQHDAILKLLTRLYMDIGEIETRFHLLVGGHDFRPRIEYFHDAVRAFSSGETGGRLSVELLAYDLSCLRYLQSMPLASFSPQAGSPRTEVVKVEQALVAKTPRPDRAAKDRLSELYQTYAALFAALLKPMADRDYQGRVDDLNQDVHDISAVQQQIKELGQGKGSQSQVMDAIQHLENDELRQALLTFMQQGKHKKKDELAALLKQLKIRISAKDKEKAAIEAAHLNYAMAQLAIFEESKDLLKSMAREGMNLVGKFVQDAMRQAKREMGR